MHAGIQALTALVSDLGRELSLEERLQLLADRTALMLETPRASVRVFNAERTALLAAARAGRAIHQNPYQPFQPGAGLLGWIAEHKKPLRTPDAEADPRYIPRPDMTTKLGSFLGVPLLHHSVCIGVMSATNPRVDAFSSEHEQMLVLIAGMCAPHLELARLHALGNGAPGAGQLARRGVDPAFPEVIARDSTLRPLSVALVSIDQQHTGTLGHEVMRRITLLLASMLRSGDAVLRDGASDLLVILPAADLGQARRVAERVRAAVEARTLTVAGESVRVTVSAGVAERGLTETREELIVRARAAMAAAQAAGRNRVES
ncbi:MAG: diguanylate cyclase [Deltaproteobacteria bacterium]|nr:diguanylate cyclase [Deltaproteobacteria bacterium]